jgi:excisionase family DNA binding protein
MDTHVVSSEYLTVAEAAQLARVSITSIRRMIDAGRLKAYRPTDNRIIIARRDLIAIIEGTSDPQPAA